MWGGTRFTVVGTTMPSQSKESSNNSINEVLDRPFLDYLTLEYTTRLYLGSSNPFAPATTYIHPTAPR